MSFELAPGSLLNNRYQIKKVITFAEDGGVYLARDLKVTDKNWIVKEMIPAPELDEPTVAARHQLFADAVESATQFDQSALPRILEQFTEARREYVVMEYVEGVTLQVLADMSVNPLPEKQILTWGLQICDALIYLHNRPRPFIFHALSPEHIILTPDEKIKLINYGLDRFFDVGKPPKVFADDPNDILTEFTRFGETMCFLLTKEKAGSYGLPQSANVSTEAAKVINRTLQGGAQKTYASFEDVRRDVELALNPPAQPKKEASGVSTARRMERKQRASARVPAWQETANRLIVAALSQRRAYLYAELVVAFAILLVTWWHFSPGGSTYRKTGEVAYVAVGFHDMVAFDVLSQKIVDRRTVSASIGDIAVSGSWLFVSDSNTNRILRLDVNNNEPPEKNQTITVDRNPTRMVADDNGKYLFVVHEPTRNVSRVNLTRDPPQMDAILAVGNVPHDLALSPNGQILFVANAKDLTVSFIDPDTSKNLGNVQVSGTPYGMAVAPAASQLGQLWVAVQNPDSVIVIDIANMQVKETITELMGGSKPTSVLFSADGNKVYVTMSGTNNVVVFDAMRLAAFKTIGTAQSPQRIVYTRSMNALWVTCAGDTDSVTVINPASDSPSGHIQLGGASGPAAMSK